MVEYHYGSDKTNKESGKRRGNLRKVYHQPQIIILGDLRTLTLGGTIGTGDSGCEDLEKTWDGIHTKYPCP